MSNTMAGYEIVRREPQPYAAIPITVPMQELGTAAPPLNEVVFQWLRSRGVAADGPPFWKYNLINMPGSLSLEVGVAIAASVAGSDRVKVAELPAGSYLQTTHHGHPDGLMQATADLLGYADKHRLSFDRSDSGDGERWRARLEYYLTNPDDQPDMDEWETLLAFKLAD